MSTRVKCLHCDHMILEVTARLNCGLCGHCQAVKSKSDFDKVVQGWIDQPKTLPGTHGIPEPKEFSLRLAAAQVRSRMFPTDEDKKSNFCTAFFDTAHYQWMAKGSSSLSAKQKHSLAVETFHGEVCNGGLIQYLDNESGAFANWAVEGFEAIGIPQYAAVMRKLQALFPGGVIPEDPNEREQLASELGEENLEEIEKGFWDRYNSHGREIPDKLYQYLSGK